MSVVFWFFVVLALACAWVWLVVLVGRLLGRQTTCSESYGCRAPVHAPGCPVGRALAKQRKP